MNQFSLFLTLGFCLFFFSQTVHGSGDLDEDHVLTSNDFIRLSQCLTYQQRIAAGLNAEQASQAVGIHDENDCQKLNDFDGDGQVTSTDLNRLEQCIHWLQFLEWGATELEATQALGLQNVELECAQVTISVIGDGG